MLLGSKGEGKAGSMLFLCSVGNLYYGDEALRNILLDGG